MTERMALTADTGQRLAPVPSLVAQWVHEWTSRGGPWSGVLPRHGCPSCLRPWTASFPASALSLGPGAPLKATVSSSRQVDRI